MNNDLISRKALREAFECLFYNDVEDLERTARLIEDVPTVTKDYDTGYQDGLEDGLNDIRDGWIPISERLPKAGEYINGIAKYYLVQNEYGDMSVARYRRSGYWELMYHHGPYEDEIVAWMPLPEPYKKIEEENKKENKQYGKEN